MIGLGFGALFGVIYFGKRMNAVPEAGSESIQYGNVVIEGQKWWKPLLRLIVTLLIVGVVLLPYLLLTAKTIANIYVLMVFKTLIPTFAAGFVLYCGLLEYLFVKMKLLDLDTGSNTVGSINDVILSADEEEVRASALLYSKSKGGAEY